MNSILTCNPGASRMQQTIMVTRSRMAYMSLAEVEFLQEGQAAQQREQAAEPQQHAREPTDRRAPMVVV